MSAADPMFVAAALLAGVVILSFWLLRQRHYSVLLIWPALIYVIGPAATLLFVDHPVLGRYVEPSRINAQAALMAWYLLLLIVADNLFDLSGELRRALNGLALKKLSSGPAFGPLYVAASLGAVGLQSYTLLSVGNIFNGTYVLESAAEGLIPYWGFLAGLYEIVFLCFVLLLIGESPSKRRWMIYVGLYILTTLLRVMGGTRLILIKELAFMMLLFYLRRSIAPRRLMVVGCAVVAVGSVIGLLRGGIGDGNANSFLGPLYGLVMESALNALTLGIADQVNVSGFVAQESDLMASIGFFLLSVVPSFLRFGVTDDLLASMSPYSLALGQGFDTSAPVGGMSGFATIDYLSTQPQLFLLVMVMSFSFWFRFKRNDFAKQALGLVLAVNAIHFWRDPADIAFKLVVQGLLICWLFHLLPRRRKSGATPAALTKEATA